MSSHRIQIFLNQMSELACSLSNSTEASFLVWYNWRSAIIIAMPTTTHTLEPSPVIELENRNQENNEHQNDQLRALETDPDADAIMHASLLADSEVPDGGYGWVVVFSGAVITWWFVGASYTWGVMQAALVEQKKYPPATLAFVGSLVPAMIAILAIPNATIIRKVGARTTGLTGISLLGLGSILAGFAVDSIPGLFMTWGLVCGMGTSLCFMV